MRPALLHIHVPRASGSSFHGWLLRAMGEGSVAQAATADDIREVLARRHEPRRPAVVSGHFCYGVHEAIGDHPYRYLVLLRDPIQRVLSLFRYIRSLPTHGSHRFLCQPDMTIARFYDERMPGTGQRNAMVAQLAGILGTRTIPTEEHLEQACRNLLDRGTMFGLVEDPDPLLAKVAKHLRIEEPPPYPQVNSSPAQSGWGTSEEDLAAIAAANQLDVELYRRAVDRLRQPEASWLRRLLPWH